MSNANLRMQNGWATSPTPSSLPPSPMPKRRVVKLHEDQLAKRFMVKLDGDLSPDPYDVGAEYGPPVEREGNQMVESFLARKIGPQMYCESQPLDMPPSARNCASPVLSQESTTDCHSFEGIGLDALQKLLRSQQQTFQACVCNQVDILTHSMQTKLQAHSEQMHVLSTSLKVGLDNITEVLQTSCSVTHTKTPPPSVQGVTDMTRLNNIDDVVLQESNFTTDASRSNDYEKTNGDSSRCQRPDASALETAQHHPQDSPEDEDFINQPKKELRRSNTVATDFSQKIAKEVSWHILDSAKDADDFTEATKELPRSHTSVTELSGPSVSAHRVSSDQTNLFYAQDLFASSKDMESMGSQIMAIQMNLEQDQKAQSMMYMNWAIEPKRMSCIADIVKSKAFDCSVCFVVALNAVFITYSTDWACDHPNTATPPFITITSIIFQGLFTIELLVKLLVHGLYYFSNKDRRWNLMDFALVLVGLFDIVASALDMSVVGEEGNLANLKWSVLRTFRLVRVFRIMRLFRLVRFFDELKLLLKVVVASVSSFFWCLLLLVIFMFMFSIMFVDGTANYLSLKPEDQDERTRVELIKNFHSVGSGILSLMKAMTGGQEWGPMADSLLKVGVVYYICFLLFISFTLISLMNVVTGLIVDHTFKAASSDRSSLAFDYLNESQAIVKELILLYCAMTGSDLDNPAVIDCDQFVACLNSPVIRARLAAIQLDIWDSKGFFQMLISISKSEELNLRHWVTGCMQMRGNATSIETNAVQADVQELKKKIKHLKAIITSSKHGNQRPYGSERSTDSQESLTNHPSHVDTFNDHGRHQELLPDMPTEVTL